MRRYNLLLGLASSIWSMVLSIVVVPFYLRYLGLTAYGLIGFFAALQAVLSVLDLGLAPTMSREVARCRATGQPDEARRLLHTLAIVYWGTAALFAVVIGALSPFIASKWLSGSTLPAAQVQQAILFMGIVIALRWPVGLYVGALMGDGKLAQASMLSIVATTITNVGAILVLMLVSPTIQAFFVWQAVAALAYVVAVRWVTKAELGSLGKYAFDVAGLKRVWRFSAGLSIATVLGVVFMQSDKVILSRIVSLEALGGYTIAGALARVLYVVLTPTFNIIYPRLTSLHETGDDDGMARYYAIGTSLLTAIVFPAAAFLGMFASPIILVWTHDPQVIAKAAPLVPLMAIGTALNGLMHFPYALQLATGRSRLPATINAFLLIGFLPLLTVLAVRYGTIGGAAAWAGLNAAYVILGTYMTHRVILRGEGTRWLVVNAGPALVITMLVVGCGGWLVRTAALVPIAQLTAGALLAAVAAALSCLAYPPLARLIIQHVRQARNVLVGRFHEVR